MNKPLYQEDVVLWSAEQAHALRSAGTARLNTPEPIDWENVAEEIESLGRSERNAVRCRIAVIVEHLMKLQASPAEQPQRGWIDTILRERGAIELALEDSPSLRGEVPDMLAWAIPRIRRQVTRALTLYDEQPLVDLDQLTFTEDQVLGDWFPPRA